ncbi:MAG: ABC transporter ATP-binding protein [Bacteroidota bacterium]
MIGVASILPFMQLIAEPEAIQKSSWLLAIYEYFSFSSQRQMLIIFGVAIIILIAITNIFSIFTIWLQYKYSWDMAHNLGTRLLRTYLNKPYSFYLQINTADLKTYIISEVGSLTGGVIIPAIEVVSRTFASLIIFGLLLMVDAKIALIMFAGLGGAYLLIYLSRQNFLKRIGQYRIDMNLLRYKSLSELLSGIKTVMVYNEKSFFYHRYWKASREFCNVQPQYNLILAAPRYMLELVAFGSILAITIYLYISEGNIQSALPRLSLYAVAGYRLLPSLQKAFAAAAKIRHNLPILDKLYDNLVLALEQPEEMSQADEGLDFEQALSLNQLRFVYENSETVVIKDLSVRIARGETIAFIGSTGSGKTTLVDLIVGLLHPVGGQVQVDGLKLDMDNLANWQRNIAYVPQEVFLFDDTILRNITFGKEEAQIDLERVKQAARMADIYEFIDQELPEGFQTEIGERGVRLSGGQRQRLGLARALYRSPSVLVLDEATSALDSITERGIINSLKSLPQDLTTIIIAHRLSTVRHADCIYILKDGKIVASGQYDQLMHSNETFKTMVKLS